MSLNKATHDAPAGGKMIRRSSRATKQKTPYSPMLSTTRGHTIDRKKAMKKLADATDRPPFLIQNKGGNLVITCSPTAYQVFKCSLYSIIDSSTRYTVVKKAVETDNTGANEHEILKVENQEGMTGTINFYNTTTRIMLNGRCRPEIMATLFRQIIDNTYADVNVAALDMQLKAGIEEWLRQNGDVARVRDTGDNTCIKIASLQTTPDGIDIKPSKKLYKQMIPYCKRSKYNLDSDGDDGDEGDQCENLCTVCNLPTSANDSVYCTLSDHWLHCLCIDVSTQCIENNDNDDSFTCPACREMCDLCDLDTMNRKENPHNSDPTPCLNQPENCGKHNTSSKNTHKGCHTADDGHGSLQVCRTQQLTAGVPCPKLLVSTQQVTTVNIQQPPATSSAHKNQQHDVAGQENTYIQQQCHMRQPADAGPLLEPEHIPEQQQKRISHPNSSNTAAVDSAAWDGQGSLQVGRTQQLTAGDHSPELLLNTQHQVATARTGQPASTGARNKQRYIATHVPQPEQQQTSVPSGVKDARQHLSLSAPLIILAKNPQVLTTTAGTTLSTTTTASYMWPGNRYPMTANSKDSQHPDMPTPWPFYRVSTVPTDPVSTVPTDPVSPVPTDPVSPVPTDPVSPVPTDPVSPVPTDPVPTVPTDPVSTVPTDPVSTVPTDPVSTVPTDPVSTVPADPVSTVPTDSVPPVRTDPVPPINNTKKKPLKKTGKEQHGVRVEDPVKVRENNLDEREKQLKHREKILKSQEREVSEHVQQIAALKSLVTKYETNLTTLTEEVRLIRLSANADSVHTNTHAVTPPDHHAQCPPTPRNNVQVTQDRLPQCHNSRQSLAGGRECCCHGSPGNSMHPPTQYNPIINESMASTIAIKVLEGVIRMDEKINALQNSALQQQLANAKRDDFPAYTPPSINRAPSEKTITEYNHGLGNGDNIHELEHGKWRKEPTHKRWNSSAYHQNTRPSSSSDQNWRTPQHRHYTVMRNQNRDWRPHQNNERQTDLHHWRPRRPENARQADSREQWRCPLKHGDTCTGRDPLEDGQDLRQRYPERSRRPDTNHKHDKPHYDRAKENRGGNQYQENNPTHDAPVSSGAPRKKLIEDITKTVDTARDRTSLTLETSSPDRHFLCVVQHSSLKK